MSKVIEERPDLSASELLLASPKPFDEACIKVIELEKELESKNKEIERYKGLLSVAKCPECDGSGSKAIEVLVSTSGCCGNVLPNGECCGNAVEVQEQGFELEQCQWCDELSNLKEQG